MRINIYAEELLRFPEPGTSTVGQPAITEIVMKTVNQQLFYGIRLYLASPKELHYGTSDDDRSAITLWVQHTSRPGEPSGQQNDPKPLLKLLDQMYNTLVLFATERGDIK